MSRPYPYKVFGDIPPEKKTWKLVVDGEEVMFRNAQFVLDDPAKNMMRVVECGWIDDMCGNTYDGIRYGELGGGGAVTIPYFQTLHQLYIGVVEQFRVHAGGYVKNVPRGYLKVGNTDRQENAKMELGEEVGPKVVEIGTVFQLPGEGANPNTAVCWTPRSDDGVTFHAIHINAEYLVRDGSVWRFKDGLVAPEGGESIVRCEFIPWQHAARLRDGLTMMAIARLLAYLNK